MLNRCRVLVVEDELLVAAALAAAVLEAGGEVIGPVASVDDALSILTTEVVDAAILEVHLADRDVEPVARALLAGGKAVVFHSASDVPADFASAFGSVPTCPKPAEADQVVRLLARLIDTPE